MDNLFVVFLEAGVKSLQKPKKKKERGIWFTRLVTLVAASPLIFFMICLLGALPYVFMP